MCECVLGKGWRAIWEEMVLLRLADLYAFLLHVCLCCAGTGAKNYWLREFVVSSFFTQPVVMEDPHKVVIIFHCEFSSHRAPTQYCFMRFVSLSLAVKMCCVSVCVWGFFVLFCDAHAVITLHNTAERLTCT